MPEQSEDLLYQTEHGDWHRSLSMQLKYCCKIFASHPRQSGVESEIVDLLRGRDLIP
jgi:hypothetical protein